MEALRILHLEHSRTDAELIAARLERAGVALRPERVETRADFLAALVRGECDLVLAEYMMPGFDGVSALDLVRSRAPDLPFIFVSGTLGEEVAVDMLQRGATDCVLKQRLDRLVPAVRRAMGEAAARAESRRAEEALRSSEERARLLLAAARMGMWDHDLRTGAVTWADGTAEVFGVRNDALAGTFDAFLGFVHHEDRERLRDIVTRAAERTVEHAAEFRVLRRDGSLGWIYSFGRVVSDRDGRPARFVGVGIDVTERKKAEEHLRLAQRLEAVGRLAGGVAHETNNQMAVVIGFADFVLQHPGLDPELLEDVEQIRNAAERTAGITKQLLAFSRQQLVMPEVVDLNLLVRAFEPVLRRTLGERGQLSHRLMARHPVLIDRGQLEQVLLNLALNAYDAMPRGGALRVETDDVALTPDYAALKPGVDVTPGNYVQVMVTDTGVGMARETLDRIFEPFFTTKDVGKGTGLGLSSVYGIVKQADGYVWAYSEPGVGTTFKLYFPRAMASHFAAATPPVSGGTETVLVAEDEAHVRAIVLRTLIAHGYETLEAADGQDALELLRTYPGPVHLLLTDVAMPRMGGMELAVAASRLRPELPVLLMSGYPHRDSDPTDHDDAPDRHFLDKPFAPADLLRKVREVLDASTVPVIPIPLARP